MPEKLERCVQALIDKGHKEDSAWAICRTSMDMAQHGEADEEYIKRAEKMASEKKFSLETADLDGIEIFEVGTWNGRKFIEKDLDTIAGTFQETKSVMKPFVKIGHGEDQRLLRNDELPAAGWIENVRRVGKKLLADFKKVPKRIGELIKVGAYRTRSAEIYQDIKLAGKTYPLALKAVAFLGGEMPAIGSLADVMALYSKEFEPALTFEAGVKAEVYNFGNDKEDHVEMEVKEMQQKCDELEKKYSESQTKILTLEKELKAAKESDIEKLRKDFTDSQAKVLELSKQVETSGSKIKEAEGKVQDSDAKLAKFSRERKEDQAKAKVEELVNKGKLAPAQKDIAYGLLLGDEKFKVGDKEYEPTSAILEFIEQGSGVTLQTDGKTGAGEAIRGVSGSGETGVQLDQEARKYSQENKVDYKTALIEVSREAARKGK